MSQMNLVASVPCNSMAVAPGLIVKFLAKAAHRSGDDAIMPFTCIVWRNGLRPKVKPVPPVVCAELLGSIVHESVCILIHRFLAIPSYSPKTSIKTNRFCYKFIDLLSSFFFLLSSSFFFFFLLRSSCYSSGKEILRYQHRIHFQCQNAVRKHRNHRNLNNSIRKILNRRTPSPFSWNP